MIPVELRLKSMSIVTNFSPGLRLEWPGIIPTSRWIAPVQQPLPMPSILSLCSTRGTVSLLVIVTGVFWSAGFVGSLHPGLLLMVPDAAFGRPITSLLMAGLGIPTTV